MENDSTSPHSLDWPTRWPEGAFRVSGILAILGLIFVGLIAGVVIAKIFLSSSGSAGLTLTELDPTVLVLANVLIELPAVVAVVIALPRVAALSFRELGFVRPGFRTIGIALLGTIAAMIAESIGAAVVTAFTHTSHPQATEQLFVGLKSMQSIAIFGFLACIFAPAAEETIFRLFLFNAGRRYGGFWIGAVASAILFGLAHGDIWNALPLACIGLVLAAVYAITRNAWASMISHACLNLTALIALHFFPKIGV